MENKDLMEKFCNLHGWHYKKGILIDTEMVNDDYDKQFFNEEVMNDFVNECWMWEHEDGEPEQVYDNVEEVINIET